MYLVKRNQQTVYCFINEKTWENGIRTTADVRNFTHRFYIVIDLKKIHHIEHPPYMFCVFRNTAQFFKTTWKFMKFVEWKFTSYTFIKRHLIFCYINLIKSYSKSKWYQISWDTLYYTNEQLLFFDNAFWSDLAGS